MIKYHSTLFRLTKCSYTFEKEIMFTSWSKRRKIHVEGKASLVLKRLVISGPAEEGKEKRHLEESKLTALA